MKIIKRFISNMLIRLNMKPTLLILLRTGITVKHYRNGNIIVDTNN